MKHFTHSDISEMEKVYRLNLINCVTGFKSANLIGTSSKEGTSNLAVFSSITHLGSNPPLIGFVLRPTTVTRHTYSNIKASGYYTINHIHSGIIDKAHYTSARHENSEFEACDLTEENLDNFNAPYVKESNIKLGLTFKEEIPIKLNGTILIIGQIEHIYLNDDLLFNDGQIHMDAAKTVTISGLSNYHKTTVIGSFPYARVGQFPKHIEAVKI